MCNTKSVMAIGLLAAAAYTGGAAASAGLLGAGTAPATGMALGATLAAGGMSAYSQQQAAEASAKLAERQQKVGTMQAQDALRRGNVEADRHAAQVRMLLGQQRVAQAASGGLLNSGTNDLITKQTVQVGALDTFQIEHNAAMEAWGYTNNADVSGYMASQYRQKGENDMAGTLLTTGAQAYGIYSKR